MGRKLISKHNGRQCAEFRETHNHAIIFCKHHLRQTSVKNVQNTGKLHQHPNEEYSFHSTDFPKTQMFNGIKWKSSMPNFNQIG
jgi:hypothetical protein